MAAPMARGRAAAGVMRVSLVSLLGAVVLIAGAVRVWPVSAQAPAPAAQPGHAGLPSAAAKATAKHNKYSAPRTPWGDPDLEGVWSSDEEAGVPFERPSGQA